MTPSTRLADFVGSVADTVDGAVSDGAVGARTWSIDGTEFARETPDGIEVHLDPAVAGAAVRTADTHPSQRGPGWISVRPAVLDRFTEDRLRAWIALAAKLVVAGPGEEPND